MQEDRPEVPASLEEYLSYLRLVDESGALQLEQAIRDHNERAVQAQFAIIHLAEAARRLAVDVRDFKTAHEHVLASIQASPVTKLSSEIRGTVATEYLAQALDAGAFKASGQSADEFLAYRGMSSSGDEPEKNLMADLAIVRKALKAAIAASQPLH